jgi:carboxymethylenebutenolidase
LLVIEDDVSRVSVLGFCMGGHYTFKAAAADRFDAAVAFYGMLRTPEAWQGPGHRIEPLAVAAEMCPTLAFFGTVDPWTPADDIAALEAAWQGRTDCEIVIVEGGDHGFVHDPDRPVHLPDAAASAWAKALAWIS